MTRRIISWARILACGVCLTTIFSALGCGGNKGEIPELVPVSGKVTYLGNPLAGASIAFIPADPSEEADLTTIVRPSAKTESDGGFELAWSDNAGAPPGKYNIMITAFKPPADPNDTETRPDSLIPERYANPTTSGLTAVVKEEGENTFSFDLTP